MDMLDIIVEGIRKSIGEGHYRIDKGVERKGLSLKEKLKENDFSILGELKFSSPSRGTIRPKEDFKDLAKKMEPYCACISIITEPNFFSGSLDILSETRRIVNLPLLMKDFVISKEQVEAGRKAGADALLLIYALHERCHFDVDETIDFVHGNGMEVLLEVHSRREMENATKTEADVIGINNRDLKTMRVDIQNTVGILDGFDCDRPIISASGFQTRGDVLRVRDLVDGILVGTSLMDAQDIREKILELVPCG